MKRKLISLLLVFAAFFAIAVPARAAGEGCVVLGADLSDEQIETVYGFFGIKRGSVPELKVSNAEERGYLEGLVDESVIGKYSISCVYVCLLEKGAGLTIETHNIGWITPEMYKNALVTAGVMDAKIVVAAPFEVSGTAALTGVFKAYEQITGLKLDEEAKTAGMRELTTTGELAEQIGELDATGIVTDFKGKLAETAKMSDEELRGEIARVAGKYNVSFSDSQIGQLVDLIRTMEKLDPSALSERVEQAKQTIERIEEAKDKAVSFYERLKNFFSAASFFFEGLKELFG